MAGNEGREQQELFVNEYTYTDELAERFAHLQASGKRRGVLLLAGCTLFAVGAVWVFTPVALHWLGFAPMALGVWSLWLRSNTWRAAARDIKRRLQQDEADTGRFRRVTVTGERLELSLKDGRTQTYPWSELTDFLVDDEVFAVVFGHSGVLVPKRTFAKGDAKAFGAFLSERLYPKGSMGPDTPNR